MWKLPYLVALLLISLLISTSSAGAQDDVVEETEGNSSTSVVFSGNGQEVTSSFELESGLAILIVCVGGGDTNISETTDTGSEENNNGTGEVVARAGGAEARVSTDGAVARAGGAVARSGGGNAASQQVVSFSNQTNSHVDIDCRVTSEGEASCTEQGNVDCIVEEQEGETNSANSNLDINLLGEGGVQVGDDIGNEAGSPATLSQAVSTEGGRHVLDVRAEGPWTVKVEQPRPSNAPQTTRFSGNDEAATGFFQLSEGSKSFEMTHRGDGKFGVQLLDKNGRKVGGSLVDKEGSVRVSKSVRIPRDDVYILQVEANGSWSIRMR